MATKVERLDHIIRYSHDASIFVKSHKAAGKLIPNLSHIVDLYTTIEELAKVVRQDMGSG